MLAGIVTAGLMLVANVEAGQVSSHVTNPVGSFGVSIPANSEVMLSVPFRRGVGYLGAVQSITGSNVQLSGNPGLVASQFVYANGVQPLSYALVIDSGVHEGLFLPITANTTDTVTVAVPTGEVLTGTKTINADGLLLADKVTVASYWTPKTLIQNAIPTGSSIASGSALSLQRLNVSIPDPTGTRFRLVKDGTLEMGGGNVVLLFDGTNWMLNGTIVNDYPLFPGEGIKFFNAGAGSLSLRFSGGVPMDASHTQVCTLAGSVDQEVWLSYQSPIAEPLFASGLGFTTGDALFSIDNNSQGTSKQVFEALSFNSGTGWSLDHVGLFGSTSLLNLSVAGSLNINVTGASVGMVGRILTVNTGSGATVIPPSTSITALNGSTLTLDKGVTVSTGDTLYATAASPFSSTVPSAPGASTISVAATTGLAANMVVTLSVGKPSSNIPGGTTVSSFTSNTVTLSGLVNVNPGDALTATNGGSPVVLVVPSVTPSTSVTVASAAGINVGDLVVVGNGIGSAVPANTKVTGKAGNTLTLNNLSVINPGTILNITSQSTLTVADSPFLTVASATGLVTGMPITGSTIPVNTTISAIDGTTLTLSNNLSSGIPANTTLSSAPFLIDVTSVHPGVVDAVNANAHPVITGTNIPASTTVEQVVSPTQLRLSKPVAGTSNTGSFKVVLDSGTAAAFVVAHNYSLAPGQGYVFVKKAAAQPACSIWTSLQPYLAPTEFQIQY